MVVGPRLRLVVASGPAVLQPLVDLVLGPSLLAAELLLTALPASDVLSRLLAGRLVRPALLALVAGALLTGPLTLLACPLLAGLLTLSVGPLLTLPPGLPPSRPRSLRPLSSLIRPVAQLVQFRPVGEYLLGHVPLTVLVLPPIPMLLVLPPVLPVRSLFVVVVCVVSHGRMGRRRQSSDGDAVVDGSFPAVDWSSTHGKVGPALARRRVAGEAAPPNERVPQPSPSVHPS